MTARAEVVGLGVRADRPEADPDPLVCRQARAASGGPTCGEPTDEHCFVCKGCPGGDCDCPDFAPLITFTAKEN